MIKSHFFRLFVLSHALLGLVLLSFLYWVEWGQQITPCALCLLERYGLIGITSLLVLGALFNPKQLGRYLLAACLFITSTLSGLIAARHVWLQHLPTDQIPACTAGLERLFKIYPFFTALKTVLTSSGECGIVEGTFLGLSLASASLVLFIYLTFLSVFIFLGTKKRWI